MGPDSDKYPIALKKMTPLSHGTLAGPRQLAGRSSYGVEVADGRSNLQGEALAGVLGWKGYI